ncbi:thiol-disulfide oxidoreductase DCC family protein [Streptomyces sp. NBC_01262]|uniref:thiol-disulfide oxidoreductase DCC family protein n=1 Tax=Streptomyces sp. NBC_01262 TaxID=2903803 RepID=UPI002E370C9A|nr:DCC1-like thiol-disulfide oxidoreductase family protein [Streptomyces sp. NBC_01262]
MNGLTVLYDPHCSLCSFVRGWLTRQRQLVPLDLVPVGSEEARGRFPELDHATARSEITVVGDAGQVYQGQAAWLVVLWALSEYRPMAHRLSTRAGAPLARAAVLAAAKYREAARRPEADYPAQGAWRYGRDGWTYTGPQSPTPAPAAAPGACADGCEAPR